MNDEACRLVFEDGDGDRFEIVEVFAQGEPMAAVFVRDADDHEDELGVNVSLANAERLRDWLNAFIANANTTEGTS